MSFIVQISPFVHLFTLKIVFRSRGLAPLSPPPGLCPGPAASLKRPLDPSPQVVLTFHFLPSYTPVTDILLIVVLDTLKSNIEYTCLIPYFFNFHFDENNILLDIPKFNIQ